MLKSILKPEHSVAIGVGIGAVDVFIFSQHLPPMADIRTAMPYNRDVDTSRRQATMFGVAVNGFVSLITRDWNVFLIGGIVLVGLNVMAVHADSINPQTGKMHAPAQTLDNSATVYSMPDYESNVMEAEG